MVLEVKSKGSRLIKTSGQGGQAVKIYSVQWGHTPPAYAQRTSPAACSDLLMSVKKVLYTVSTDTRIPNVCFSSSEQMPYCFMRESFVLTIQILLIVRNVSKELRANDK